MKFRIAFVLCALLLAGCASTKTSGRVGPGNWGFLVFSEVRAYRMNWKDREATAGILDERGRLNRTRIPAGGVRLSDGQVALLRAALLDKPGGGPAVECFYPHHAFVFLNASGKPVGTLNVCFLCGNFSGDPKELDVGWDFAKLESLFRDLGIPTENPRWKQ